MQWLTLKWSKIKNIDRKDVKNSKGSQFYNDTILKKKSKYDSSSKTKSVVEAIFELTKQLNRWTTSKGDQVILYDASGSHIKRYEIFKRIKKQNQELDLKLPLQQMQPQINRILNQKLPDSTITYQVFEYKLDQLLQEYQSCTQEITYEYFEQIQ
ncbi:Hypothetical_protein [Hexamita inflata]|uniref:Hypothetical_protein n=1 Tax=Hexamita inflata TaxID=28002 RepID=A0AA86PN35_9EUKA|nr:Hypothetical protein HINF_LOCUS5611 [Hexamita inflata]CAI9940233.1 Hypothetical protein HINF_LOCUS27878 [Hexamita inflata]